MELRWYFDGTSMDLRRISGVFDSFPPISPARPPTVPSPVSAFCIAPCVLIDTAVPKRLHPFCGTETAAVPESAITARASHSADKLPRTRYTVPVTDVFTKKKRSQVMAAIRSKGNKATELKLTSILRAAGITGWRRHQPIPGHPDFIFRRGRLAIFVDGCFWHGCRWHCRMP